MCFGPKYLLTSPITDRVTCLLYFKCNKWIKKSYENMWQHQQILSVACWVSGISIYQTSLFLVYKENCQAQSRAPGLRRCWREPAWLPNFQFGSQWKGLKLTSMLFGCCSHCNRPYLILYYTPQTKPIVKKGFTAPVSDRTVSLNSFVNFIDF